MFDAKLSDVLLTYRKVKLKIKLLTKLQKNH